MVCAINNTATSVSHLFTLLTIFYFDLRVRISTTLQTIFIFVMEWFIHITDNLKNRTC